MSAGQVSEQHARFLTTGRVVLATCALLSLPAAFAQTRTDMADAADESVSGTKCGSMLIRRCSSGTADVAHAAAVSRWEPSSESGQVVVTAERIRKATIAEMFERHLGSGNQDMVTTDRGAGVRCTVARSGSSACSRAANETPGSVGPRMDLSDWTF